jgi:hypothetical protein
VPDRLKNVKAFLVARAYDGFGARAYVGHTNLDRARAYIHEWAVPQLYAAVKTDDPAYDPMGPATSAATQDSVLSFVRELRRDMEALGRIDPYGDLHLMMCQGGQGGCFMEDLYAALSADCPDWQARL